MGVSNIAVHRRVGEQEISSIIGLARVIEAYDGHKALDDHAWLDLAQGGRKGIIGFIAETTPARAIVGYLQISGRGASWALELLVHPKERGADAHVAEALLEAGISEIRRQGGGHVHMWMAKPNEFTQRVAMSVGLTQGRDLLQLRRPLPLEDGGTERDPRIRTFVVGEDEDAWLEVNNKAFDWHPEQGGWLLETLLLREAEPWFNPQGFFLYELEGQIAAFCWTKIHRNDDESIGEIYVIGTDPAFGGRGLGERLCRHALSYLSEQGCTIGMLYVDATNAPARRLYEKLGFHIDHIDRAYVADLPPA